MFLHLNTSARLQNIQYICIFHSFCSICSQHRNYDSCFYASVWALAALKVRLRKIVVSVLHLYRISHNLSLTKVLLLPKPGPLYIHNAPGCSHHDLHIVQKSSRQKTARKSQIFTSPQQQTHKVCSQVIHKATFLIGQFRNTHPPTMPHHENETSITI